MFWENGIESDISIEYKLRDEFHPKKKKTNGYFAK
jgi:hypothetical protein